MGKWYGILSLLFHWEVSVLAGGVGSQNCLCVR